MSSAEPGLWVVDASVAFGWFVESPASAPAVRLLESSPPARLLAPELVLVELLNLITRDQRLLSRLRRDPQAAGMAVDLTDLCADDGIRARAADQRCRQSSALERFSLACARSQPPLTHDLERLALEEFSVKAHDSPDETPLSCACEQLLVRNRQLRSELEERLGAN
ncbi:MAG: PIN domain-containing protein [Synechococcaceae cyanobacterium]|nr:PIN domain-containing protein [Synechococcaceae cyanobacterium]